MQVPFPRGASDPAALPPPPDDARAASDALVRRIADELDAAGGWLRFDRYMARALYEPGLGYYSGGSRKFGAEGDFVTAPEMGPLFGGCLARQLADWFDNGLPQRVTEFGAGSGALAATLLQAFDARGLDGLHYDIVELSGELRARQQALIAERCPQAAGRVRWLDRMPEALDGAVIGNEVLDAMPVRLFRVHDRQVLERGIVRRDRAAAAPDGDEPFAFEDRPADPAFEAAVRITLAAAGWPPIEDLPADLDYLSELGEQAVGWVATLCARLRQAAVLLVDYGFPSGEYFHPQRAQGTLVCHYRHRVHDRVLRWPGLQDLTAHVDFGAVARAAVASGADWLGYTSQGAFLLNVGLLEAMSGTRAADPLAMARQAREVQQLVSEAEMGELFKVCAFGRGASPGPGPGFVRGDRSHRLMDWEEA